jgi:beta-galactosidase
VINTHPAPRSPGSPRSFAIGESDFLLDGEPFRVLAGALHYFRVHPDLWADRIRKARQMGLNTIETYVPWNEHSPQRGVFDTADGLDLARFLDLVAAEGLLAIVRPGPYICAEWDNGGLPAWLFSDPEVGVRRNEPRYMAAIAEYFDALLPIVAERQIDRGGPVVLVQIENEYGAYGDDKDYLRALVELTRAGGITVPLTTIDQPTDQMLDDGGLPELHKTGSFGSRATERLATLRAHQSTGPLMCAEFWNGWFDYWGAHHHTTSAQQAAAELDELLASGASVNLYMLHGGTNFGFSNGANDKGVYQPTTTSYDYDAPLTESGEPGPKYWAFRDVIAKYSTPGRTPEPGVADVPVASPPAPAFEVALDRSVTLAALTASSSSSLGTWARYDHLPTLDELAHYRGFALYRATAPRGGVLAFGEVRDRAQVFLDGAPVGVLSRDHHDSALVLPAGGVLTILVEDQGRVNYGQRIGEHKGLIGPALLDGSPIDDWEVLPLRFDDLSALYDGVGEPRAASAAVAGTSRGIAGPAFASCGFEVDEPADLFLSTANWGKGNAFVNGFNLGRYWSRGPATTLYVPGPLLRTGRNELVVFETIAIAEPVARFVAAPELGHTDF